MEANVGGKRASSPLKTSWIDNFRSWTDLSCSEAVVMAHDRGRWKSYHLTLGKQGAEHEEE